MQNIHVRASGKYKWALEVNGVVVLVTENANIARTYARAAQLHYTTSSEPYYVPIEDPKRRWTSMDSSWTYTSSQESISLVVTIHVQRGLCE
jgi:hypothetical protein